MAFILYILKKKPPRKKEPPRETYLDLPIIRQAKKSVEAEIGGVDLSVIGTEYRRSRHREFEKIIDGILDNCVKLILARIDAHTAAIFFPTNDGGYTIRHCLSKSESVNRDAVIYPGVGVIGSFLKDGLKQLKLTDIVTDSITLYYYTKDAGIRSLMASPIIADGVERGTIIVDSTEKDHFTDEDHAYLATMAELLGRAVYHAYLYNQHKLDHERLVALSNTEKYFFQERDIDGVLDKLVEIIPFAFHCERLMISLFDGNKETGSIKRVWGQQTDGLLNLSFSLQDKSLANIVFNNYLCLFRNFSEERYEIRHGKDEPQTSDFGSFLAYPLGVDTCKGTILVESVNKNTYTERNRDLMARLVSSAGIAIEKIQILHQTENLAIRDGLTGLYNHRQFQLLLKEAITRSIRYTKPLALVICDIDHFKKVNDTYGHRYGDTVLKTVASKLQSSIREGIDNAARYGGEEFALILAETDATQAFETVDRIRQQISLMIFQNPVGTEMPVTLSFGIAVYGRHAKNQELLIGRADKALYKAKENGRNRVELYYETTE
jgi:diguanylate cyclase (GGDEF)-like protein